MAAEDQDSRTEEPTYKRIDKAREEGDILQSQEVKTAGQLLGVAVVVWMVAPLIMSRIAGTLAGLLDHPHAIRVDTESGLVNLLTGLGMNIGGLVGIIIAILLAFALVPVLMQTGLNFTTEKLRLDLERINPISGFGRVFSVSAVVELLKGIAKISVVGTLCYMILLPRVKELELLVTMEIGPILEFLHGILIRLLLFVVALVTVIAGVDWLYQRHAYLKKLRMTKQEVKDENKQSEGDPMIRSRLRSIRMSRARQRMMAAVPKADVVVTNPTHFACALKYEAAQMNAPVLVAKGKDLIAKKIREVAEENEIPIVENPPLARALFASVELDQEVPPAHYKAVAEVISYVMRLKDKKRRR